MSDHLPWDNIAIPDVDYNVRLVTGCGAIPVYWGKNCDGKFLCLVSLVGDHQALFIQEKITIKGLHVDLRQDVAQNYQNLVLTLERQVDSDLFHALCKSLVLSLSQVSRPDAALSLALQHLKRWRLFLMGRNAHLLTAQEYRGLFAELLFLKNLLEVSQDHAYAIMAWSGPDGIHQDFIFSGRAVEIKSLSSSDPSTVRISSENQLESIEGSLYLVCFLLSDARESPTAISLNNLVEEILEYLEDENVLANFEEKLADYGYIPLPEYDSPKLIVADTRAYLVSNDFPKIVRSELPAGIVSVHYQIELDKINAFACDFSHILEDM